METILNSLGKPLKHIVRLEGSDKPIILNAQIQRICDRREAQIQNDLGMDIPVTTMTSIAMKVSVQKFYTVGRPGKNEGPGAYFPIKAGGQGAWSDTILTYRSFQEGDAFETGYVNLAQDNGRIARVNAGVDGVPVKNNSWAKGIGWNIMQLQTAAKAGNWDYIEALERSLKKNYDLGLQRISFLGADGFNGEAGTIQGLLTQPQVKTSDSGILTKFIKDMNVTEFQDFVGGLVAEYRENCNFTAWPNKFVIPENDYNGLTKAASADFPLVSKLKYLLDAFREICGSEFEILPLAYANASKNTLGTDGAGANIYALYNAEEETVRMDVPVPYTGTVPNSIDGFTLQKVSYSQHTGVVAYRPAELLYFKFPAAA